MVASLSISGCLSSLSSSNQAAPSAAGAASPSASASASATSSITPLVTPAGTPTPGAVYQVVISGPTVLNPGEGGLWTATVYKNGLAIPQADLTNQIDWFIDGHAAGGFWGPSVFGGPGTLFTDANGESTTWAPFGAHTLNAEYLGDPSHPNTSITVTSLGGPSATPTPTPTPTPTVTPTPTPTPTSRIIRIV